MAPIRVLTPTGTLGYGFGDEALERGLSMAPDAIAVDAGSTDPGPYHLGAEMPLVADFSIRRELEILLAASRKAGIPLIIGSAGGGGSRVQVDHMAAMVRDIAVETRQHFNMATIYADIDVTRAQQALNVGEIIDFEAGIDLTSETLAQTCTLVAQMGHEPICAALDQGADVIIAGRACDDSVIAAYPIWRGADPGLSIHMGKILECGAFSAEPFAMDVMLGTIDDDHFLLEPGSNARRASVKSVAAHSLYERENPYRQGGPGHVLDLTNCTFTATSDRIVKVSGASFTATEDYYVKLEGARLIGYRAATMAGIRCPTLIARLDDILADVKRRAVDYYAPEPIQIIDRVYGRNGVMGSLEVGQAVPQEVGLLIDVIAQTQDLAHAACHQISGALLHYHYPGIVNPSGNLAFPYSPSEFDLGPAYEFSVYHLMKTCSPDELFPVRVEEL